MARGLRTAASRLPQHPGLRSLSRVRIKDDRHPVSRSVRRNSRTDKQKKAVAKRHRQIAKPGVLGCVYRLSGGGWGKNKYGDPIKVGLWGYSENMGVKMDLDTALEVVRMFREVYPEICQLWYKFEKVVHDVLKGPKNAKGEIGPGGCVKIDKLNRKGKNPVLRIQLPSKRYLHYIDAHLEETKMPWKKKVVEVDAEGKQSVVEVDVYKPTLVYSGVDQQTHQWTPHITSHGGKLTENVVQSIARDVLAEGHDPGGRGWLQHLRSRA